MPKYIKNVEFRDPASAEQAYMNVGKAMQAIFECQVNNLEHMKLEDFNDSIEDLEAVTRNQSFNSNFNKENNKDKANFIRFAPDLVKAIQGVKGLKVQLDTLRTEIDAQDAKLKAAQGKPVQLSGAPNPNAPSQPTAKPAQASHEPTKHVLVSPAAKKTLPSQAQRQDQSSPVAKHEPTPSAAKPAHQAHAPAKPAAGKAGKSLFGKGAPKPKS